MLYTCMCKMSTVWVKNDSFQHPLVCVSGFSVAQQKNIMEGRSIILDAGVILQNETVTWYYNDILIALVTGDLSDICTDVECNVSNDIFRDRLELDFWGSWSLIIKDASSTDSGLYTVKINKSKSFSITRSVTVTINGELRHLQF